MRFYQLDNDTKKYVKRLNYNGVKTPTDIYSVDQFIRGLKDLGVWSDVLDGWIMRSNQNAGSGVKVYALKNTSNDGTLENGGIWTANGIYLRGEGLNPSQKIRLFTYNDFPNGIGQYGISVCGIVQPMNWSDYSIKACTVSLLASTSTYIETRFEITNEVGGGSTCQMQMYGINYTPTNPIGNDYYFRNFSLYNLNVGRFNYVGYIPFGTETNQFVFNSASAAQGSAAEAYNYGSSTSKNLSLYIGPKNSYGANGMFPFVMYFNNKVGSSKMLSIYSLAKDTISKGLALP
jgi:hypothetical protein